MSKFTKLMQAKTGVTSIKPEPKEEETIPDVINVEALKEILLSNGFTSEEIQAQVKSKLDHFAGLINAETALWMIAKEYTKFVGDHKTLKDKIPKVERPKGKSQAERIKAEMERVNKIAEEDEKVGKPLMIVDDTVDTGDLQALINLLISKVGDLTREKTTHKVKDDRFWQIREDLKDAKIDVRVAQSDLRQMKRDAITERLIASNNRLADALSGNSIETAVKVPHTEHKITLPDAIVETLNKTFPTEKEMEKERGYTQEDEISYNEDTGKNAIWRGKPTKGFLKWVRANKE